jgi:hypothetical protein
VQWALNQWNQWINDDVHLKNDPGGRKKELNNQNP